MNVWFAPGFDFNSLAPTTLSKWQYIGNDGLIPLLIEKNVGVGLFTVEPTHKFHVKDADATPATLFGEYKWNFEEFVSQITNIPLTEFSSILQQRLLINLSIQTALASNGIEINPALGTRLFSGDLVNSNTADVVTTTTYLRLQYNDQVNGRIAQQVMDTSGFELTMTEALVSNLIKNITELREQTQITDVGSGSTSLVDHRVDTWQVSISDSVTPAVTQFILNGVQSQLAVIDTGANTLSGLGLNGNDSRLGSDDNNGLVPDFTTNLANSLIQMSLLDAVNDLDLKVTLSTAGGVVIAWSQPTAILSYTLTLDASGIVFNIDGTDIITIKPTGLVNIVLPAYDDDAAAGVGGLVTGDQYQTTGAGAAPLNVAGIMMVKQ